MAEPEFVAAAGTDPLVVIRREERIELHTEVVPVERVRLQKFIVSEEQTFTVTVRREEVRLVREAIQAEPERAAAGERGAPRAVTDETAGGETAGEKISEDGDSPRVMTLREERVVFTTEVVPVERVWLRTERVVDSVEVSEVLAHEEIEITRTTS